MIRGGKTLTISPHNISIYSPRVVAAGISTIVYCTFNAANGTNLTAYPWTDPSDVRPGANQWDNAYWSVFSNRARSSVTFGAISKIDSGFADVIVSGSLNSYGDTAVLNRGCYLTVRGGAYHIGIESYNDKFYILNSSFGVLASTSVTIDTGTFYDVIVTVNGTTITATLNGGNQINYNSATINQSTTTHGLCGYLAYIDNFQVTVP